MDTSTVQAILENSYQFFRDGELGKGITSLEQALSFDYESSDVMGMLKCAHFWRDRENNSRELQTNFEQAEYLYNQWRIFVSFHEKVGRIPEQGFASFRHFVCGACLDLYEAYIEETSNARDPDMYLRLARCWKGRGEFDKALSLLEAANQLRKDDAGILSELADCWSVINEQQRAKAFFREAFFIDPQAIDIFGLESRMMQKLVGLVKEAGYTTPMIEEWIPVYAVLHGVFNVKRELRSIEYGKLKQSIYAMEVQLRESSEASRQMLEPRLLFRYFWLIDHYVSSKEDRERINEVLLKIKGLNKKIYEHYVK